MKIFAVIGVALISVSSFSQTVHQGSNASRFVKGAKTVRESKTGKIPSFVAFKNKQEIPRDRFNTWYTSAFYPGNSATLFRINSEPDKLGHQHERYQLYLNGYPVEGAIVIAHSINGSVYAFNGEAVEPSNSNGVIQLSEKQAFDYALNYVNAVLYRWQIDADEERLKLETGNNDATYFPKAELVFINAQGKETNGEYRLAYKFNIYAVDPLYRADVFVDAETGAILSEHKQIHFADVLATAVTGYSGTQTITTDSFSGGYRLRESGRGNGIFTYNMQNGTSYGGSIDFVDSDNFWNTTTIDQYATDAHFGAEKTYDYFYNNHGRNSIDNNGFALYSYVHYDVNFFNAFWDGQRMTYGDGNSSSTPLTALDIAGHEITHGLTEFTADLVYQDESGALNESFSDIFGTAIEFYAYGSSANWTIGEDIGVILRSMSNPGTYGDPDTYQAGNWYTGTNDNGGVHTNSGVQNYWFYLLTTGGSGTNDLGETYSVTGIGITKASEIAFRNLTVYLTPNSTYEDARFYAIQSAIDLYGACTPEVIQTTNAWHAVGVGDPYQNVFETDFTTNVNQGCLSPFTVNFDAVSLTGGTGVYSWDFGDGTSAGGSSPSHTYTTPGAYTVTLIEDGGICGVDTAIAVNAIYVGQLAPPVTADAALCSPGQLDLFANGTGSISWWDAPTGGNLLDSGNIFTTPNLSTTTSYWVELNTGLVPDSVGPKDNTFGAGGFFTGDQDLIFDAYQPFTLVSTLVYANGGGNRTIELRNSVGTLIQSATINIPNGQSRITLNFSVPAGTGLRLGTTPGPDLYRNSAGAVFPYQLPGVCSITGTTASAAGYYYFFYDWEIDLPLCSSDRKEVIAAIAGPPSASPDTLCAPGSAFLQASGTPVGTLNWYDAPSAGNLLGSGSTFSTPVLTGNATYYVEEEIPGPIEKVGPVDNSFGTGGYFNGNQYLEFDVLTPVILESVLVFANGSGNRTIELRNSSGTVLQDTVVFVPGGTQRVYLNFDLPAGTDFQLGTLANSNPDLFRNNAGPSYPYTLPGKVSITSSSAGNAFYYFFYDWEIRDLPCITPRTPVVVEYGTPANASINPVPGFCPTDPATQLTGVQTGGFWSGPGITDGLNGTFDPSVAGNGIHEIHYTINGVCGDSQSVNISVNTQLDATITDPGIICTPGNTVQLTAADFGGTWSGTGLVNSQGLFDPALSGTGSFTIVYEIGGACGDTQSVVLNVADQLSAQIDPVPVLCSQGPAVSLVAADPGGVWSGTGITDPIAGTFDPALVGIGNYPVTYSITAACGDTQTVTIAVEEQTDATILSTGPYCSNEPLTNLLALNPGGSWSGPGIVTPLTGAFNPALAGAGTHTITYTFSGNCPDQSTVNIDILQAPDASVQAMGPYCSYEHADTIHPNVLGGVLSGPGVINGTLFDPGVAGVGNHVITHELTDPNGCTSIYTLTVTVYNCTGVAESGGFDFVLYPNPTKGLIYLKIQEPFNNGSWALYDMQGRLVRSGNLGTSRNLSINLETLEAGTYNFTVSGENGAGTRLVVVK